MGHLGQDQVEETWGSFCCVAWTDLSELAKLIEQLVTAEGGNLLPAAFPSLSVTAAWSLNMAIQQQQKIQLKKLFFCKAVRVGHIKKELDECCAGDKRKSCWGRAEAPGQLLLVMSCQVGWAVLYNCILAAFWEVRSFNEVQWAFWFSCHGLLRRTNKAAWYAPDQVFFLCLYSGLPFEHGSQGLWN